MKLRYDRRALKRLRAERQITLEALARSMRMTHPALSYIERGMTEPKASTLAKLASALDVPVDAFFVRKDAAA